MQVSQLDFSTQRIIPDMLNNIRIEIEYLDRSGAFIPHLAIDPAKMTDTWSELLIKIGNQLRPIINPMLADTAVYNIIEAGMVLEGLKILIEQDVFYMSDVYRNLHQLLLSFRTIYGQALKRSELQAQQYYLAQQYQAQQYGKKHKRKCKGKAKCNCR